MFNEQLLAGRRILVTGGGTGLGKSMAARFLNSAPRSISAAGAKASATKPRPN
jgi:NAD(P)-dependent dehydrogenase (short-subunit alcohol dehydrogenase family)